METKSRASRKWKPVSDLPEPRNSSFSAGANTIAGRLKRSLRREATMPTTPWCQASFHKQILERAAKSCCSSCLAKWARAVSCMPLSITRRSRLMRSSSLAIVCASTGSSVSKRRIPSVISAKRPAALSRGPSAKPKSKALAFMGSRAAALKRAVIPSWQLPFCIRRKPLATKMRLLRSSCATSATVPRATKSRRFSILGWLAWVKWSRERSSARSAINR